MTSANLLIIVLIGLVVGAMMGLALHGILDGLYLAVVASFVATVIACAIRNTIMVPGSGAPDESRMPIVVSVFSIVASLAGSAAAAEVARHSHHQMPPSIWIGALAGLFSSILMAMLMIVHHLNPDRDADPASLRKTARHEDASSRSHYGTIFGAVALGTIIDMTAARMALRETRRSIRSPRGVVLDL